MTPEQASKLVEGCRVVCQGQEATFRDMNPRLPGDLWIEFDCGGGWWSFDPSDVEVKT